MPNRRPVVSRVTVLGAVLFFVAGYFLFNLFSKQVLQHQAYAEAAQAQSTSVTPTPAPRGTIYATDKDGKLYGLAVSEWQYQLMISPRQVRDKAKLLDTLATYKLPNFDKATISAKVDNDKVFVPPVLDGIDAAVAGKISAANLQGVFMIPKLVRVYPDGASIAPQVLGFVGADGHGKYGVEQFYDSTLQGTSGSETAKQNSLGQLIDILSSNQAQAGSDLVLSLDYNLQFTVENKLKDAIGKFQADSGTVVVLDAKSGSVLAMAGQPNYDPNNYSKIDAGQYSLYQTPAVADVYEAGSVFKPLTMSAALDLGLVKPTDTHTAGASVTINGHTIINARNKDFGTETPSQIIQNSDNVQMASWVSALLGADNERSYFAKYGIGAKTGLDIAGEQSGTLPKLPWPDILRANGSFGQGVSTTVIQLATDYAAIANGGNSITPRLIKKIVTGDSAKTLDLPAAHPILSAQTAKDITQMLVDTVNLGEGKRAGIPGVQVAGKTGTAQVPDGHGGYSTTNTVGSFAGFFPAADPRFVMVVRLNDPKTVNFAESSAAPTFGTIADWMANYYGLR